MTNKKLKDLRKGDRIWYWNFTDTTPIYVDKAKREGGLMRITVRWDESIYECVGLALGFTCVAYDRKYGQDMMFTCSYDLSKTNEQNIARIRSLVPELKGLISKIEEL